MKKLLLTIVFVVLMCSTIFSNDWNGEVADLCNMYTVGGNSESFDPHFKFIYILDGKPGNIDVGLHDTVDSIRSKLPQNAKPRYFIWVGGSILDTTMKYEFFDNIKKLNVCSNSHKITENEVFTNFLGMIVDRPDKPSYNAYERLVIPKKYSLVYQEIEALNKFKLTHELTQIHGIGNIIVRNPLFGLTINAELNTIKIKNKNDTKVKEFIDKYIEVSSNFKDTNIQLHTNGTEELVLSDIKGIYADFYNDVKYRKFSKFVYTNDASNIVSTKVANTVQLLPHRNDNDKYLSAEIFRNLVLKDYYLRVNGDKEGLTIKNKIVTKEGNFTSTISNGKDFYATNTNLIAIDLKRNFPAIDIEPLQYYIGMCLAYGVGIKLDHIYVNGKLYNVEQDTSVKQTLDQLTGKTSQTTTAIAAQTKANIDTRNVSKISYISAFGLALTGCTSPLDKDYQAEVIKMLPFVNSSIFNTSVIKSEGNEGTAENEWTKSIQTVLAMTNFRKVLKLDHDSNVSKTVYSKKVTTLYDLLNCEQGALYCDDSFYDASTDRIFDSNIGKYGETSEELKQTADIIFNTCFNNINENTENVEDEEITIENLYNKITNNDEITKSRSIQLYKQMRDVQEDPLGGSNFLRRSNKIFTIDKYGYATNNIPGYINYLYIRELKNNIAFTSNSDLAMPVFCDPFGNIITAENRLIVPAISNYDVMKEDANYEIGRHINVLYQSRALSNILNFKFEIPLEAYDKLYSYFLLNANDNDKFLVKDGIKYQYDVFSKFIVERTNTNAYIYLAPDIVTYNVSNLNLNVSDVLTEYTQGVTATPSNVIKTLNTNIGPDKSTVQGHAQTQNSNDLTVVYNKALYDNQDNIGKYLEAVMYYVLKVNSDKANYFVGEEEKELDISNIIKDTRTSMFISYQYNISMIMIYTLCSAYNTEYSQYLANCIMKIGYNKISVVLMSILDSITDIVNNVNISIFSRVLSSWNDNQLNFIQIIMTLLVFGLIISLVISILIKTSYNSIITSVLSVFTILIILFAPIILNNCSILAEKLVSNQVTDTILLDSLVSKQIGKRKGLLKDYRVNNNEITLRIYEDKFPTLTILGSILRLDTEKSIKNLLTAKAINNSLSSASVFINRSLTSYSLDIISEINNIGIRDTTDGIVLTYTDDEGPLNFYTITLPIMRIAVERMKAVYDGKIVNSNLDYSENLENFNKTYGIGYYYADEIIKRGQLKEQFRDGYDYTGLVGLFRDYIKEDISKKVCYDDSALNTNVKFGVMNTENIKKEFNLDLTEAYIKGTQSDRLYEACRKANEVYYESIEKLQSYTTGLDDTVMIYFASLKAALAFNTAIEYNVNSLDLSNASNDSLFISMLFGNITALNTAGKTMAAYLYGTYNDNLLLLTLSIILYVLLCVSVILKAVVLMIALGTFIFSIVKVGLNRDNIEGLVYNGILFVVITFGTNVMVSIISLMSSSSNNIALNIVILSGVLYAYIMLLLSVVLNLLEDSVNVGKNIFSSLNVSSIKNKLGNSFEGVSIDTTFKEDIIKSEKHNIKTATTNNIDKMAQKYTEETDERMLVSADIEVL